MTPLPLYAVLLAGLAAAQPASQPASQPVSQPAAPEAAVMQREDLQEIFALLLNDSGYDDHRKDQARWNKPERGQTLHLIKDDDASLRVFERSPAAALAANTGMNNGEHSKQAAKSALLFMHLPSLQKIAKADRGILAFILAHEFRHLINHDPESVEQNNLDHFWAWCRANQELCDSERALAVYTPLADKERARFIKPLEDRADGQARAWLRKLKDPKTGKPFGVKAAEDAMVALKDWLKENKGSEDGTGDHSSLDERLAKFQAQRLEEKARAGQIRTRAASALGKATAP